MEIRVLNGQGPSFWSMAYLIFMWPKANGDVAKGNKILTKNSNDQGPG
jgi:hypothetical protein